MQMRMPEENRYQKSTFQILETGILTGAHAFHFTTFYSRFLRITICYMSLVKQGKDVVHVDKEKGIKAKWKMEEKESSNRK